MFKRIFGPGAEQERAADLETASFDAAEAAGETATVRRIVARLEAMPPERARLVASAAYTLARAAQADLDISAEETAVIERELQAPGALDEPTAVLVTEMAKLQARTVGGTEDYVVTREFARLATEEQKIRVLRACFAVGAANEHDLGRGIGGPQPDREGARPRGGHREPGPRGVPRAPLVGPGRPARRRRDMTRRSSATTVIRLTALAACLAAAGCGDQGPSGANDPVVVTFEVAGEERFKALLTEPADIDTARRLLDGEDVPSIPNGRVIRETGVNEGYGWSLDPNDIEFASVTIEECDGLPSDVEAGVIPGDRYCPWSAVVIAVEPAG